MLGVLREISVTCFCTSYLVVLALELLRIFGRLPGRALMVITMTVVGLFTHITFLWLRAADAGDGVGLLATWSDWSLLLALGLAIGFLIAYLRRPETVVSFFFLPAVLVMIGVSLAVRSQPPFSRNAAVEIWRTVHALSMTAGCGIVLMGFLAGVMHGVQAWRLKNHRAGSGLKLPTLETLVRWNRGALVAGTITVGVGWVAGVVMNLNRWGQVGWTDRGVILSTVLFIWLIVATLVEYYYAPVRRGRKSTYLTLASAGFLALAMYGVMTTPHGQQSPSPERAESASAVSSGRMFTEPSVRREDAA